MASLLIDNAGNVQDAASPDIPRDLRTDLRGERLVRFVVTNLGWVHVDLLNTCIRVRCRPSLLSDDAIAGTLYAACDLPSSPIVFEALSKAWTATVFHDRRKFTRFLSTFETMLQAGPAQKERHLSQSRPLVDSPFEGKYRIAQSIASSTLSLGDATSTLEALFDGRWSIYVLNPDAGRSDAIAIGNGYTPFNPKWSHRHTIPTTANYADHSFGLWVVQSHKAVSESDNPLCQDIDAIVNFSSLGDVRLRYTRLLLLLRRPGRERLVLSAAVTNSAINLRGSDRQIFGQVV